MDGSSHAKGSALRNNRDVVLPVDVVPVHDLRWQITRFRIEVG